VAWGAGLSAQAWDLVRERFGCDIRECYGMTECSSFATLNQSGMPGSIGKPLPWVTMGLLDEHGNPVEQGGIGEIVLSSDVEGVFFPAYLDNPEATAKALCDGLLHTGDSARQLPDGSYVFVGRRTDNMRVRGENVSAWEIERIFIEHPAVKAAAAIGVASTIGEQEISLFVELEPGMRLDWSDLVAWAQPQMATYQLPRYYQAIDNFERTPSERIRKHLLPPDVQSAWDRFDS
jgi:crotonobetaine/carnitine-CoA ligase